MTIHKGNIEAYLLDYLEGNLDPLLTAELMAFMAENPGYEKWLPEYDGNFCIADGLSFDNKSVLRKDFGDVPEIVAANFEEFCIASAEGLLRAGDISRLMEYLSVHPEKQQDYELYHHLKLHADTSLVFPAKEDLKKPVRRIAPVRFIFYALGAAASLALLVMLVSRKPPVQSYTGTLPDKAAPVVRESSAPQPLRTPAILSVIPARQIRLPVAAESADNTDTGSFRKSDPKLPVITALASLPVSVIISDVKAPELRIATTPVRISESGRKQETKSVQEKEPSVVNYLASVMKKINLWKAAKSAVSGFNYLTESQLSLTRTLDQNGKPTGWSLIQQSAPYEDTK